MEPHKRGWLSIFIYLLLCVWKMINKVEKKSLSIVSWLFYIIPSKTSIMWWNLENKKCLHCEKDQL
jgi:hypothetical protein